MQMLPIAQIGSALSQNQWTEELPHADEAPSKPDAFAKFNSFIPPVAYTTITSFYSENKASDYIHHSERIPSNHSTDVVSPPPDAAL